MEIFEYIGKQQGWLRSKTQNADDIIQDVYEKVWRLKDYFEAKPLYEQKRIAAVIIRNRWYDTLRREKIRFTVQVEDASLSVPPEIYSALELEDVLKDVPDFMLDYLHGYTTEEVTAAFNFSENSLRFRIHHKRKKLLKKFSF